ncbi:MAG: hypothetical protein M3342_11715 [Bacteroidota bacterium]|nr:hypothetical protein [Bacteroidota bacterium]
MRLIKVFIWTGFIVLLLVMRYFSHTLQGNSRFGIVALELAKHEKGKEILRSWARVKVSGRSLLKVAEGSTYFDFLFIIFYTALLFSLSNSWRHRAGNPIISKLLRMNLPLALLAGGLDVVENCFLLYDMRNWQAEGSFITTWWIASLKFLFIGWAILVLLLYILLRLVDYSRKCLRY